MKNKLLIYFLALFMGFCIVFSPHITFNVSAALPITLADWDDIAAGVSSGTSGLIDFEKIGSNGYFRTSTNYDLSNPNSFEIKGESGKNGPDGYWNLTDIYSYIGIVNFSFITASGFGNNNYIEFQFKNNGTNMIRIRWEEGTPDALEWYDVSTGWHDLYSMTNFGASEDKRHYLIFTHNGTNHFNIKVYNATFVQKTNDDYAGANSNDYLTFDSVYIQSEGGFEPYVYIDNFIIDTTWRGGEDIPEGYLGVNCFNETSGENITDFNVLFVNQEGDSYYQYMVNNTWVVWGDLLPQGECICTVSKTGYYPRSYLLNVEDGYFVIDGVTYAEVLLNAYLPSINLSALYYIQVIDEYLYPVEDVSIRVQGWCGETEYRNVSITETDGYGLTQVYLCWGKEYQVSISKAGYVNKTESWIPDPSQYGIEYPKVFRIYHIGYNITPEYDPWDYITFEGWMYTNGTIQINYEDIVFNETINATFYTYEINGSNMSSSLVSTNNTTNNTFTFWVYDINASRMHCIYLYLNHTTLGSVILHICLSPVNITDNINETDIENKIVDVFGDFALGYVNFFFVFLPAIFLLVIPGHFHPGIGILAAGMWLGFGSLYFGLPNIITLLAPFLMMIGTILMVVKGGASKL